MNSSKSTWVTLVLAAWAWLPAAQSAAPTLKVGDPAPKLQTGKWVQGDPVKEFEPGKAYLVEFWATWCGPCRTSIPHLNEIATRFKTKGLVVIGQNVWENDDSLVEPFVRKMGDKMTYRVALDDKTGLDNEKGRNGRMARTWMDAAGQNGIPSAFLVDTKGQVAWIGHPMTLKDPLIEEVLAGKFDVQKAAAEYAVAQEQEARSEAAWNEVARAMKAKNWDAATARLDDFAKLLPEQERDYLDRVRFDILLGRKDYPAAYQLAARMSEAHKDEAMFQNELAWHIATDPSIEQRDLVLAETLAKRGNDLAKGEDAAILDTLARVYFLQDRKAEAIVLQEKAVKLADGEMKEAIQRTLDGYRKGELPKPE